MAAQGVSFQGRPPIPLSMTSHDSVTQVEVFDLTRTGATK